MAPNPHFDEDLLVWSDEFSGRYPPPASSYDTQFDLQWKLALDGDQRFQKYPGADIDDEYIKDRVYEWTGKHPDGGGLRDAQAGARTLDHPLDPSLIRDRVCVDIGCGMGRWTRTMQMIGARSVLSIDASDSALRSVARFNDRLLKADITRLPQDHPELTNTFEFACFWGVAMCTHDPRVAFLSAASLVKPGGSLYLMVYAPEGIHGSSLTNHQRRTFARLESVEARLDYVDHVYERRWDRAYPLKENAANLARKVLRRPKGGHMGVLDMLQPTYNWVIPLDVIHGWMRDGGFAKVTVLNELESPKAAFHVLGTKS